MIEAYDPLIAPDPEEWLKLDEGDRLDLVEDYHREARVKLPNARLHATIHVIVENQLAMGDETAAEATLKRLMRQGLDRHEAIHAIGSVLADHLQKLMRGAKMGRDPNVRYNKALDRLTAARWRRSFKG